MDPRINMKKLMTVAGLVWAAGVSTTAWSQEVKATAPAEQPAAAAAPAAPTPPEPIKWTDADFEKVAGILSGSWKSKKALAQGDSSGASVEVVLGVAPVRYPGLTDTMYFETARADALHKPFRQGIWQLYRHKGELRMRTFEFRRAKGEMFSAISAWASPDYFPNELTVSDLIGTLDLKLTVSGDTVTGKTPYPYPTGNGGAVEMTSEFTASRDSFKTMDRGYDASGKVVWGPGAGESYEFSRVATPIDVKTSEDGLVVIDYKLPSTGEPATNGWRVAVWHTASLMNGVIFDSSRERDRPFILTLGSPMPLGVARGLEGIKQGDIRRFIVPPALGFGEAGNRRSRVPGNATLFYEIEAVTTEAPQPAADPAAGPAQPGGPTTSNPKTTITPIDAPPFKVDPNMLPGAKKDPAQPK